MAEQSHPSNPWFPAIKATRKDGGKSVDLCISGSRVCSCKALVLRCLWTQERPRRIVAHHYTSQTLVFSRRGNGPGVCPLESPCLGLWNLWDLAASPVSPPPILNVSVSLLNTLLVTYMDRIECLSTDLNLTVRKRSLSVALDQVWQNKQDRNLSRPLGLQTSVTKVPAAHVLGLQGQAVYPAGADPRLASHLQKTLLRSGWAGGVSFPAGRPAFVCY